MKLQMRSLLILAFLALPVSQVWAGGYQETIGVFQQAGESGRYFSNSYAYAVFPTIGKAGIGVGGAHGKGRVFVGDNYVGDTSMTQLTIGFQLGGQAFSQIIFLQDRRAFDEFTGGNFEFGAHASAIAVTAGASASATTTGSSTSVSGGQHDADTDSLGYYKGMVIFTVAKGGLMYEASVGGQKFTYTHK